MKKTLLILSFAMLAVGVSDALAQDKVEAVTTERSAENIQKEADALKHRIEQYTAKIEANKDKVDYETELNRIAEMKIKWESLTDKKWVEEKKKAKK